MNGSRPPAGEPMPRLPHCDIFLHFMPLNQRYKDDRLSGRERGDGESTVGACRLGSRDKLEAGSQELKADYV